MMIMRVMGEVKKALIAKKIVIRPNLLVGPSDQQFSHRNIRIFVANPTFQLCDNDPFAVRLVSIPEPVTYKQAAFVANFLSCRCFSIFVLLCL